MPAILIVVTNHEALGDTGKPTGWYLPEVAHPYHVFKKAGCQVTFLSPKGGKAPIDPGSLDQFKDDPVCKEFLADKAVMTALDNTRSPSQVKASDYNAILYAGGHGPMWDLPDDKAVASIGSAIYAAGGVVASVCHGVVGFIPVKKPDGSPVVQGEKITCFTDSEERAVQLEKVVPFLLETRLRQQGSHFVAKPDFQCNVQVSGRLVSGQNPASATLVGEEMVKLLKK